MYIGWYVSEVIPALIIDFARMGVVLVALTPVLWIWRSSSSGESKFRVICS